MLKVPRPSKVRAKAPAEAQARARSKRVTDKDLAETRERIIKAADELDMQLEYELEKIRNWRNITDSYPLEIITGVFSTGYIIGSGILGEVIGIVFFGNGAGSAKNTAKRRKSRLSLSGKLIGLIRFAIISAISAIVAIAASILAISNMNRKNNGDGISALLNNSLTKLFAFLKPDKLG